MESKEEFKIIECPNSFRGYLKVFKALTIEFKYVEGASDRFTFRLRNKSIDDYKNYVAAMACNGPLSPVSSILKLKSDDGKNIYIITERLVSFSDFEDEISYVPTVTEIAKFREDQLREKA
jgi:hypothetical protein